MKHHTSRRNFLKFMGVQTAATAMYQSNCSAEKQRPHKDLLGFKPLTPQREDRLVLVEGLSYELLVGWGDPINESGDVFGYNNDYIAIIPDPADPLRKATMWVNHETASPYFVGGFRKGGERTRVQVDRERKAVGGSVLRIQRSGPDAPWQLERPHSWNRRISGETPIPIISERPIRGRETAIGTLGNCAGGVTPWGTILTCEENYHKYYGEVAFRKDRRILKKRPSKYGWEAFYDLPPEHYGWVVEVDPATGYAQKLTGLGRCAHECATTALASDQRCVVYTGDDQEGECLYKFIAASPGQLKHGILYVANLERGRWLPLDLELNPDLRPHFKDQTELLIRTREAAHLAGGTPLDRPEDIEIHPHNGDVYVCLTNSHKKGNYHGSILKVSEKGAEPGAMDFTWEYILTGGPESGFSCPDNLVFDRRGNLWLTSDISESDMPKAQYRGFGNNGLFYIPLKGESAGRAFQVASAPTDAEFTGPCFSPDGESLFLAVQHPGSQTPKRGHLTSHWPDGCGAVPRPSVVTIGGPLLKRLVGEDS